MSYKNEKQSWRIRRKKSREPLNVEEKVKEEQYPTEDDIVLKNRKSGANIRIKDNGVIQMFSGDVGIKIDPNSKSIYLKGAEKIGLESYNVHINTLGNGSGFKWNHIPFSQDLADPTREVLTTIKGGSHIIENALTTGLYTGTTAPGGGPVVFAPGPGMAAYKSAMVRGGRVYGNKLPPSMQQIYGVTEGVKDIAENLGLKNLGLFREMM